MQRTVKRSPSQTAQMLDLDVPCAGVLDLQGSVVGFAVILVAVDQAETAEVVAVANQAAFVAVSAVEAAAAEIADLDTVYWLTSRYCVIHSYLGTEHFYLAGLEEVYLPRLDHLVYDDTAVPVGIQPFVPVVAMQCENDDVDNIVDYLYPDYDYDGVVDQDVRSHANQASC